MYINPKTGIESVWNNKNFWTCIQDSSKGVGGIQWDLRDQKYWEPLVAMGNTIKQDQKDDEEDLPEGIEADIPHKLPLSWCQQIKISKLDFETRAPEGKISNNLRGSD